MSMHERAEEEIESLDADLANGEITQAEYNRYVRDISEEMQEYEDYD